MFCKTNPKAPFRSLLVVLKGSAKFAVQFHVVLEYESDVIVISGFSK